MGVTVCAHEWFSKHHDDINLERDFPGAWTSEILLMDDLCGEAV